MANRPFSIRLIDHIRLAEDEAAVVRREKRMARPTKGQPRNSCKEGHDLTDPANVLTTTVGRRRYRRCRTCKQIADHNYEVVRRARAKVSEDRARERRKKEGNT